MAHLLLFPSVSRTKHHAPQTGKVSGLWRQVLRPARLYTGNPPREGYEDFPLSPGAGSHKLTLCLCLCRIIGQRDCPTSHPRHGNIQAAYG